MRDSGLNSLMTNAWDRARNLISRAFNLVMGKSPAARFFRYYIITILVGSLLLFSSFVHKDPNKSIMLSDGTKFNGKHFSYADALFTASSAFSDTGLTVTNVSSTFNIWGQITILLMVQVGGFGYMTIKILIWKLFRRQISLNETLLMQAERGRSKLGGTIDMVIRAIWFIFVVEIVGMVLLTILFYTTKPSELPAPGGLDMYHNFKTSLWGGLFHSVSAINNAGFDIIGGSSLGEYRNAKMIQIVIMMLFIVGGLGFPVLDEIFNKVKSSFRSGKRFTMSAFVKISLVTYWAVAIVGVSMALAFELTAPNKEIFDIKGNLAKGSIIKTHEHWPIWHNQALFPHKSDRIMAIVFNTFSTRNAGFATMNMDYFTLQTQILFTIMMFIGAAPSSTAGGIRTTTFALGILAIHRMITGKKDVEAFNRRIPRETVLRALTVIFAGILIVLFGTIIVLSSAQTHSYTHDSATGSVTYNMEFGVHDALFEVASAFGTTGLSTGMTPWLNTYSKVVLIVIMFAGQLGISNSLTTTQKAWQKTTRRKLSTEDIIIG